MLGAVGASDYSATAKNLIKAFFIYKRFNQAKPKPS